MDTIINILLTLIGLSILTVVGIIYFPYLEKLVDNKFQLGLSGGANGHGILGELFYKYRHSSSKAWMDWIVNQTPDYQTNAIDLLVAHLEKDISHWGALTCEAIIALSVFKKEEFLDFLKNLMSRCKESWKRYRICEKCYEAALIATIRINPNKALDIFTSEVENLTIPNQAGSIIKAMQKFKPEVDIKPLAVRLLCKDEIPYKLKREILNYITVKLEALVNPVVSEAAMYYLSRMNQFELDELKLIDDFLEALIQNVDATSFKILYKACNNMHTTTTAIRILEKAIKHDPTIFSAEQLYNLLETKYDKKRILQSAISEKRGLTMEERKLIEITDLEKKYGFEKEALVEQEFSESLDIPAVGIELYEDFKLCSKYACMSQTSAGGLLLTGGASLEKLVFARTLASDKRWRFFYTTVSDLITTNTTLKALVDRITSCKPCMVYLDGCDILLNYSDADSLSKNFLQILCDPMVTIIGGMEGDLEIQDNNEFKLEKECKTLRNLFSRAMALDNLDENEKNLYLGLKINKLELNRDGQNYSEYNILNPSEGMSLFEFDTYLSKYFKAALLTSGKLISSTEFKILEESKSKY